MEQFEESREISKINDAGLSISRLNDSWNRCKLYIRSARFNHWRVELDNIWMELFPDVVRNPDKEKLQQRNTKLMKKIVIATLSKNKNKIFFSLMQRHCFLREVQDIAGKAGVYRNENEEDFE